MPQIMPITDLRKTNEISDICHKSQEPIFVTKNGYGDLVVMSIEAQMCIRDRWKGAILSWSSAMAGAAVCFYIARLLGRDAVEKLTSRTGLKQIDEFFEKHGRLSILIARLLPFISFDIVSYAAGLTSMSFGSFFIATGIGQMCIRDRL